MGLHFYPSQHVLSFLGFCGGFILITTRDDLHFPCPSHRLIFNFMRLFDFWTIDLYVVLTLLYYICLSILIPVVRTEYEPLSINEYFDAFCRHLAMTSTVMWFSKATYLTDFPTGWIACLKAQHTVTTSTIGQILPQNNVMLL